MDFNLHDSLLGKHTATPEKYNASLLFRIPRSENRIHYGLEARNLPFIGYDVWNCYEVSFLTDNGLPVSRVLKIIYSSDSEFLVESKSLKLYLNAFNMDRFGKTVVEACEKVQQLIVADLKALLETPVKVIFFDHRAEARKPFSSFPHINELVSVEIQESISFSHFNETPGLLKSRPTGEIHKYVFQSDLLRSNCRVTDQPDWGDLFVQISTKHEIDLSSVIEYLVSFRKENHFHEEVVEMIYKRFYDHFEPEKLMVSAMYTRRGGIDINPIRASHAGMIDEWLVSAAYMAGKTLRQ